MVTETAADTSGGNLGDSARPGDNPGLEMREFAENQGGDCADAVTI